MLDQLNVLASTMTSLSK